jgi:hypothetical protein
MKQVSCLRDNHGDLPGAAWPDAAIGELDASRTAGH